MKLKTVIAEIVIITSVFILTYLVLYFLTGSLHISNPAFDINLRDTYFVVAGKTVMPLIVIVFIFLVYSIKEGFYSYRRTFQNLVLLVSSFLINIYLFFVVHIVSNLVFEISISKGSWALYPPLSALPRVQPTTKPAASFDHLFQILLYFQIFFLIILVIVAILTGKNWNSNKNVS